MVLTCIRLGSGDQIPVDKNTLSFSIKVVRFLIVCLETDNENVYSFTHSFVNPLVILLSIFSLDIYFHLVCLVCRCQTRQTLTTSTLEFKQIIYIQKYCLI